MTVPNRISPPPGVIYDDVEGVCRPATPLDEPYFAQSPAEPQEDRYAYVSRSALLADAFGTSRSVARNWGSPTASSLLALFSGPVACSAPAEPVQPGDPVRSATPQGAALTMNAQPLHGNLNEYDLSGNASSSAVAWSVFNSTAPAETGTFAFVRDGGASGTLLTVSNDSSSLHKFTSSTTLDDGSSLVAYTKATGEEEPSSIVAHRISAGGAVEGSEITILAAATRGTLPDAQLVANSDGFVAVYRDGNGRLMAAQFNASGARQGEPADLGPAPTRFTVNRAEDGRWILAEIASPTEIRVRSFSGTQASGVDETITTGGFSSTPSLSVAMEEGEGTIMVAWNATRGIQGAVLNGQGDLQGAPFSIRDSGLANTMSLASDHRGNFIFAWEEGGSVLARVYNGTSSFYNIADFSNITTAGGNSNVQAHVSDTGRLVLTWVHSTSSGGETLQDLVRREYQLNY